jgi:hypothetical protein
MDIVYVCRDGENEELRYSIRSAVANIPHDNLWVVGGKPDWYGGKFLESEKKNSVYHQVWANLEAVINCEDISDDFILMNDDFFVVLPVENIGAFYNKTIKEYCNNRDALIDDRSYTNMLRDTADRLYRSNKIVDAKNYELHVPFIFNKQKLQSILGSYLQIRSAYGNIYNIGGDQMEDVKVYDVSRNYPFSFDYMYKLGTYLSTEDGSFEMVKNDILDKLFPAPSENELDR